MTDNQEDGVFMNWKNAFFWSKCFQFSTFFQILCVHHQLAIPNTFYKALKETLEGVVKIEGKSGAYWYVNVGFSEEGEALFLGNGWKKLATDNFLEKGDVLFFTYKGNSHFDLVVLNPKTHCEKDTSFFVRKSDVVNDQIMGTYNVPCIYPEIYNLFRLGTGHHIMNADHQLTASQEQEQEQHPIVPTKKRSVRRTRKNTRLPLVLYGTQGESCHGSSPVRVKQNLLSARRRSATEEEREMAKQKAELAQQLSNVESFIAIMRPSYVYSRFFMCIPHDWLNKNIRHDAKDIILRMEERTWKTRVQRRRLTGGRMGCTGGLGTGWKCFAEDNSLREDDACLFKLVGENVGGQIILDVDIFHVI